MTLTPARFPAGRAPTSIEGYPTVGRPGGLTSAPFRRPSSTGLVYRVRSSVVVVVTSGAPWSFSDHGGPHTPILLPRAHDPRPLEARSATRPTRPAVDSGNQSHRRFHSSATAVPVPAHPHRNPISGTLTDGRRGCNSRPSHSPRRRPRPSPRDNQCRTLKSRPVSISSSAWSPLAFSSPSLSSTPSPGTTFQSTSRRSSYSRISYSSGSAW